MARCKYGKLKSPYRDPKTGRKRVCKRKPKAATRRRRRRRR